MERSYFIGPRQIDVVEIDDVLALRLDPNEQPESFGAVADGTVIQRSQSQSAQVVAAAFQEAGWHFVVPNDATRARVDARQSIAGVEDAGLVILHQAGTIAVAPYRLNVRLRPDLSHDDCLRILAANDLTILRELRFAPNLFYVASRGRDDAIRVAVRLHDSEDFVYAEPSLVEHLPERYTPTDPDYGKQWHWNNTGQTNGKPGADVSAEAAWDVTRGSGIRVAVLDRGFLVTHPDLAGGISASSGYFDDTGVFHAGIATIPATKGHGTECAGMVGARENTTGGCGGAPQCEMLLIAVLQDPVAEQGVLARAVAYAIDPQTEGGTAGHRADVVSCSMGPIDGEWVLSGVLEDALIFADGGRENRGTAIFWSASNRDVDSALDGVVSHANVVAVVTSNHNDEKKGHPITGDGASGKAIELIAPGTHVWLPVAAGGYTSRHGTSMATPCAAACAALALAAGPSLTREQLRQILRKTADKVGGVVYDATGHNDGYGYGRVNARAAVLSARFEHLVNVLSPRSGCAFVALAIAIIIMYLMLM